MVKTRVFDLSYQSYRNLSQLAQAMGISISQVYRVRDGKRGINQSFIVGAIKAFPGRKFDDLSYFSPELPAVTNDGYNLRATIKLVVAKRQKASSF